MTKHDLAEKLRNRQRLMRLLPSKVLRMIDKIPDDAIINSYITCSCCGKRSVTVEELPALIARAQNDEDFFDLIDQKKVVFN